MQIYQERKKIHKFLRSKAFLAFMGIFVFILLVASLNIGLRAYQSYKAKKDVENEYERLLSQKEKVDQKIKYLDDPDNLEKEAKKRFNKTIPGEKVLVIVDSEPPQGMDNNKSPISRFWDFLKHIF